MAINLKPHNAMLTNYTVSHTYVEVAELKQSSKQKHSDEETALHSVSTNSRGKAACAY